jgi:hypothetical protein
VEEQVGAVARDEEVEPSVPVVVAPGRAHPRAAHSEARRRGDVDESAAVVAKQLRVRGRGGDLLGGEGERTRLVDDEEVGVAVPVVVAPGEA